MPYYCYLNTDGGIDQTNLQLYSLEQAASNWNAIVEAVANHTLEGDGQLKERLAFTLSCLGLSLSQLLGQVCPSSNSDKIPAPDALLDTMFNRARIDRLTRNRLTRQFKDFLSYYDTVRHFGKNKQNAKYHKLDQLTLKKAEKFCSLVLEIWDVAIDLHKKNGDDDIEIESMSEIVEFNCVALS